MLKHILPSKYHHDQGMRPEDLGEQMSFKSSKLASKTNINWVENKGQRIFHLDNKDDKIECKVGVNIAVLTYSGSKCNIISEETWELKNLILRYANKYKNLPKYFLRTEQKIHYTV